MKNTFLFTFEYLEMHFGIKSISITIQDPDELPLYQTPPELIFYRNSLALQTPLPLQLVVC